MGSERRGRAVHGRLEVNPSGEEPTDRPRQKNAGLWEPYDEIGSRRCELLFAAPGQPLAVIEIDGSQHRSQALIDMRRDRALANAPRRACHPGSRRCGPRRPRRRARQRRFPAHESTRPCRCRKLGRGR